MNLTVLVDAIVRQTTVLIAELATNQGLRAPLAHLADQVFLDLAGELDAQGLSRKVSADMFGMALRTYQRKVRRVRESGSERGRTLWDAVYTFIRDKGVVNRTAVLDRFKHDEEALVRGVLTDLVEHGLVFATGPSQDTSFRVATDAELGTMARVRQSDELLWVLVFRCGPVTLEGLMQMVSSDRQQVEATLGRLIASGRVRCDSGDGEPRFRTTQFHVPLAAAVGWEAAVFDHYHAVVRTIIAKLRERSGSSSADDAVGGSTYSFEVWPGHPFEKEVTEGLRRFRESTSALRARVRAYNASHSKPEKTQGVVLYAGQYVYEPDSNDQT